jgi:serine protease Do
MVLASDAMNRRCAFIALFLFALPILGLAPNRASAQGQPVNPTNRLHMYSKPAVVRIITGFTGTWSFGGSQFPTSNVSSGSGFIISSDGYIMTNAHVVSDLKKTDDEMRTQLLYQLAIQLLKAKNLEVTQDNVVRASQILLNNGARLAQFQKINYVFLQSGTRLPFEIKAYGAPVGEGKDVSILKVETKNAPTLRLGDSEKMQVGDKIYVIGYPGAADSEALDAKSQLEPTTNDGSISAKKTSAEGAPVLQTNANTTHGNSGGPVINDKGEVIGLLTFRGNTVNGQEVQGFNFIIPSSTAQEFVRQAGTDNKISPVDEKWREGLNHYWKQEYSFASQKFSEITALFPDHSEARKLITDCQEHIARGEDKSGAGIVTGILVVGVIVVGGVVLLIVAVVIFFVVRKKPSGQLQAAPVAVGGPFPVAVPPTTQPAPNYQRTEVFSPGMSAGASKLLFTVGPLQSQSFPLTTQGMYIGRDPARAQIVVSDPQVSGQHLWIGLVNGQAFIRDNGSSNGTFLNFDLTNRVRETALKTSDVVSLGGAGTVKFTIQ